MKKTISQLAFIPILTLLVAGCSKKNTSALSLKSAEKTASISEQTEPDGKDSADSEPEAGNESKPGFNKNKIYWVDSPDGLTVRDQPSKNGKRLFALKYLATVEILQVSDMTMEIDGITAPWMKIKYGNAEGWSFGGFLKKVDAEDKNFMANKLASETWMVNGTWLIYCFNKDRTLSFGRESSGFGGDGKWNISAENHVDLNEHWSSECEDGYTNNTYTFTIKPSDVIELVSTSGDSRNNMVLYPMRNLTYIIDGEDCTWNFMPFGARFPGGYLQKKTYLLSPAEVSGPSSSKTYFVTGYFLDEDFTKPFYGIEPQENLDIKIYGKTLNESTDSIESMTFSSPNEKLYRSYFQSQFYEPLYKNLKSIEIIGDIKEIDEKTFRGYENLEEIKLQEGIESLGDGVFFECKNLRSITIPESVTELGDYIFAGCSNLETVIIKGKIKKLPFRCFKDCSNLKKVVLPESLKSIEEYAFYNCENLESLEIPESVETIQDQAFEGCTNLKDIKLPSTMTELNENVF